jgi:hypothetical protein
MSLESGGGKGRKSRDRECRPTVGCQDFAKLFAPIGLGLEMC